MLADYKETISQWLTQLIYDLAAADVELAILAVLCVVVAIVFDGLSYLIKQKKRAVGLVASAKTISIDGSSELGRKEYVSAKLGLAGRPDGVIKENGYIIPVERKPFAKKIRDRYVAQLLVYMRLIEEVEGIRPPYGYLILGKNCRQVKIDNSPEREAWLNEILGRMRAVSLKEREAKAAPTQEKCARCDVAGKCQFKYSNIR